MKTFLSLSAATVLGMAWVPAPLVAQPVRSADLSSTDIAKIDALAAGTFERIRGGKSNDALNYFFANSPLATAKVAELKMLGTQIDTVSGIYGSMGECRLAETKDKVGLVAQRLYICQHDAYLTRWKMLFVKSSKGWAGANVSYDDKVQLDLSE